MSWKEIKHSLNSSVGTDNFKPLNEIVDDAFGEIVAEQNTIKQKLYSGENDFYVSRAKNVDLDGFLDVLEQYKTARIASGTASGTGANLLALDVGFTPRILMVWADYAAYIDLGSAMSYQKGCIFHYYGTKTYYEGDEELEYDAHLFTKEETDLGMENSNFQFTGFEPTDSGCTITVAANALIDPGLILGSGSSGMYHTDVFVTYHYTAIG